MSNIDRLDEGRDWRTAKPCTHPQMVDFHDNPARCRCRDCGAKFMDTGDGMEQVSDSEYERGAVEDVFGPFTRNSGALRSAREGGDTDPETPQTALDEPKLARAIHEYSHLDSEPSCDAVMDAREIATRYNRRSSSDTGGQG